MQAYNQLSSKYNQIYCDNIESFCQKVQPHWSGSEWFNDFYPSFGVTSGEECDLLFYGQATNGWRAGFDISQGRASYHIEKSILASNSYLKELNHSPLDWVNVCWSNSTLNKANEDSNAKTFYSYLGKYRTCRSFFWNVAYKLTSDYHGFNRSSWDWTKKAVWL